MNTIRFLTGPDWAYHWPPVIAGLGIALVCALLSPLVVLRRLSFVGQGISHAAFGGIGVATVLVTMGTGAARLWGASPLGQFVIVLLFCLACAILIAWLTDRGASNADTAIGIVLVGAMTVGAILIQWAAHVQSQPSWQRAAAAWRETHPETSLRIQGWESILFGSIVTVGWQEAAIAWGVAAVILVALWWVRRPLMFWAFDEAAAPAFGVRGQAVKYLLVVLLTLAIVTAMKLAGVVLATALLVLPGAAALRVSDRLARVLAAAAAAGLAGVLGGLVLAFEAQSLPPGACIVGVLVLVFAAARGVQGLRGRAAA